MRTILVIGGCLIAGIVLLIGIVALVGSRLPRTHSVSRSMVLQQPPAEVYRVIRDVVNAPQWRADVKSVVLEPQPDGRLHFREVGKQGTVNYELAEDVPGQRMVTRILDTDLGYSGKWTYVLTAEGNGTRITITEDGEVSNVIFRFMSRYVFGQTATIETYLTALAQHLAKPAEVK